MEFSSDIYANFERAVRPERRHLVASKWKHILSRYNEPHRHYHSWSHIQECHGVLWNLKGEIAKVDATHEVFLAIVYHDVVYEIGKRNNEMRSAVCFRTDALDLGLDESTIRRVHRLILQSTYSDGSSHSIFGDIDLSGLGADRMVFRQKSDLIRREQSSVPDETYWRSRSALMRRFLSSPKIYYSQLFATLEARARENLVREIKYCEDRLMELK